MGIRKQNQLGMVVFSLSNCFLCMLFMLSTSASWRLHNKLHDQEEDFPGLKRTLRGVPRVMLAHGEEEYQDERGSDIADRGMMMGLRKRGWPARTGKPYKLQHGTRCGFCSGQEDRLHGLEE